MVFTTNLVSVLLFSICNYRNTGKLMKAVVADRTTTSLIVQVLSSVLGMIQIYTATTLFNLATRIWLLKHSIILNKLKFWSALSLHRVDLTLPKFRQIVIVIAVLAAAQVPGALWAGSTTPIITTVVQEGSIPIPTFTFESKEIWDSEFYFRGPRVRYSFGQCTIDEKATRITSCPIPYLQGQILGSASSATTMSGALRDHSKIDSPSWQYKAVPMVLDLRQGWFGPMMPLERPESRHTTIQRSAIFQLFIASKTVLQNMELAQSQNFMTQMYSAFGKCTVCCPTHRLTIQNSTGLPHGALKLQIQKCWPGQLW
jgi:hypothetical protein